MKKECCRDVLNLCEQKSGTTEGASVLVCLVCSCRHYVLKADPGYIGMRGSALGR